MSKGDAADPHSFSALFCEFVVTLPHPFSIVTTTSQLFSDHLSSSQFSQLFSTALKVVSSLPTSAQLFSPLPCPSQLFSTTLTSAHLVLTLLNSSQLVSTLLTSCHLFNSSHLFSPPLNSSHLFLSSSQLFSPLANSSELLPTFLSPSLVTGMREAFAHSKLLHRTNFYTVELLHAASF